MSKYVCGSVFRELGKVWQEQQKHLEQRRGPAVHRRGPRPAVPGALWPQETRPSDSVTTEAPWSLLPDPDSAHTGYVNTQGANVGAGFARGGVRAHQTLAGIDLQVPRCWSPVRPPGACVSVCTRVCADRAAAGGCAQSPDSPRRTRSRGCRPGSLPAEPSSEPVPF